MDVGGEGGTPFNLQVDIIINTSTLPVSPPGVPPAGLQPPPGVAANWKQGEPHSAEHWSGHWPNNSLNLTLKTLLNVDRINTLITAPNTTLKIASVPTIQRSFLRAVSLSLNALSMQVKKLTKFFGDEPPLLRLYLKVWDEEADIEELDIDSKINIEFHIITNF